MPAQFIKLNGQAVGGDVAQLRQLSDYLTNKALTDLKGVFDGVDGKMNVTTWAGTDADKFATEWNDLRMKTEQSITAMLQDTATRAKQQADAQEQVSQV